MLPAQRGCRALGSGVKVGLLDCRIAKNRAALAEEDPAQLVDDLIPEDIRDFILRYIDSIAQLEALLLLRRNPHETWTAETSAKRLYISENEAGTVLDRLCADGLLSCNEGRYQFSGQSDEQQQMVARLAEVYSRHLIQVTNLIHAKPRRLREFAEAFKIRKERS